MHSNCLHNMDIGKIFDLFELTGQISIPRPMQQLPRNYVATSVPKKIDKLVFKLSSKLGIFAHTRSGWQTYSMVEHLADSIAVQPVQRISANKWLRMGRPPLRKQPVVEESGREMVSRFSALNVFDFSFEIIPYGVAPPPLKQGMVRPVGHTHGLTNKQTGWHIAD